MSPPLQAAIVVLAAIVAMMTAAWLISIYLRDASIVDVFWGLGFVLAAWLYFVGSPSATLRAYLVVALATVWGLRLSAHILWRRRGEVEDYRYREMRDRHPRSFPRRSLVTVFWLQGLLLWAISAPFVPALRAAEPERLGWLDLLALLFFGLGMTFEAGGDWQLARFKSDPANRGLVCDRGLWRYTRHPNYFGDAMVWWGFFLFAAAVGAWWTVYSPVLMTILLVKVSGVALLEKGLVDSKAGYSDYVERTSAFFPWFPKTNAERGKGGATDASAGPDSV